ncbi:MAG TPA: TAT-variant-translocated molybdopterin oxidoreductase [Blastocatellia bacterium]
MGTKTNRLDLTSIRARLSDARGKQYWRSLDELADTPEFQEFINREFPSRASEFNDALGRRRFLKVMGASMALAGLAGCVSKPKELIVPYVQQPEEIVLGKPLFFATAMTLDGVATGVLVESHEGRPTKVEGNPSHPASLGATDVFAQASVLSLYDPDRSQSVTYLGDIRTWSGFLGALQGAVAAERGRQGAGIRILTETVTSPTLAAQIKALLTAYPQAKWHQYDPASPHNTRVGATIAFGQPVNTIYKFDKADVVLSLDSDFLLSGPGATRYIRDFASRRKLQDGQTAMNRLYVVSSTATTTGAKADHTLPLKPSDIQAFAASLATALGVQVPGSTGSAHSDFVQAAADDLKQHHGSSIVIVGENQPPAVHAIGHALNNALGNVGSTVFYTDTIEASPVDQIQDLSQLMQSIDAGAVNVLLILGGNPVYNAPADFNFAQRLAKVPLRAHLAPYYDETSDLCHWHIPEAHYLESWGDARAYDGTASIIQPLIAPLYGGKSAYEVLAAFTNRPEQSTYEIVRSYWKTQITSGDFEKAWRKMVHDGVVPNTALPPKTVTPKAGGDLAQSLSQSQSGAQDGSSLEIIFRPDPSVHDGRFANNGWLQELPKPLTKITWDNAVLMSPSTAQKHDLSYDPAARGGEHGWIWADMVELEYGGGKVQAPIWIIPGHADDCITVHLGYGRTRSGRVAAGAGFNAYALRTSTAPGGGQGAVIHKIPGQFDIACTQFHFLMNAADQIRSATLDEYKGKPTFAKGEYDGPGETASLYPNYDYSKGYAWGMTIDVNACVGCNACVVACQSENNIPVVGKEEVNHGREMHWIRLDRYYTGDLDNPRTFFQPVPCMQCENAPCELVCPVQATNHSAEGLNDMVYNRCVGTRYCSNNCPYKVRRFNFFQYADYDTESIKMLYNPDVTVRSRGVMEKCTYCVQRISHAKIEAEKESRPVRDGEILTACQAVCPAEAITFGNINDSGSKVAKLKAEPRNYGLLSDLNTRPRTTYLAPVVNPNPELKKA